MHLVIVLSRRILNFRIIFQITNRAQKVQSVSWRILDQKISGYAHSHSPSYYHYRLHDGYDFVQNMMDTL
jgi:hypothetical protein